MRHWFILILAVFLIIGTADIFARRGGSRSVSRPRPSPTKTIKTAPKKTRTDSKSTIKKKADSKKQKAVSKNKMDRKDTADKTVG